MPSPPTTPRSIRTLPPFPPAPRLGRAKLKSSSLDHDLFLSASFKPQRSLANSSSLEWQLHTSTNIPRTASTSSVASSVAPYSSTNTQEFKTEIINQGKCLCGQYIRARLRRAGALNRKAIQRLRSILEPSSNVVYEIFPALNAMGEELERMHPRVYNNVARQLSRAPYGELVDGDTAPVLLNLVAKELFARNGQKNRITWAKIISIFAISGGFAIDCVRQGHYDYLGYLVDGVAEIIEDDLINWLGERGGWLGLQQHIRPQSNTRINYLGWLTLFVALSSGVYVITNFFKHIGCRLYSFF